MIFTKTKLRKTNFAEKITPWKTIFSGGILKTSVITTFILDLSKFFSRSIVKNKFQFEFMKINYLALVSIVCMYIYYK